MSWPTAWPDGPPRSVWAVADRHRHPCASATCGCPAASPPRPDASRLHLPTKWPWAKRFDSTPRWPTSRRSCSSSETTGQGGGLDRQPRSAARGHTAPSRVSSPIPATRSSRHGGRLMLIGGSRLSTTPTRVVNSGPNDHPSSGPEARRAGVLEPNPAMATRTSFRSPRADRPHGRVPDRTGRPCAPCGDCSPGNEMMMRRLPGSQPPERQTAQGPNPCHRWSPERPVAVSLPHPTPPATALPWRQADNVNHGRVSDLRKSLDDRPLTSTYGRAGVGE